MKKNYKITLITLLVTALLSGKGLASSATTYIQNPRNPPKNPPTIKPSHLRVGVNLGYNIKDWQSFNPASASTIPNDAHWDNGEGAFNYGFDLNYLYGNNFFFEIGWYSTNDVSFQATGGNGTLSGGFTYAAVGHNIELTKQLSLFGKGGVAYNYNDLNFTTNTTSDLISNYWNIIYSAGFEYEVNNHLCINLQYMLNPGSNSNTGRLSGFNTPASNMIDLTLNYQFNANNIAL